MLSISAVK